MNATTRKHLLQLSAFALGLIAAGATHAANIRPEIRLTEETRVSPHPGSDTRAAQGAAGESPTVQGGPASAASGQPPMLAEPWLDITPNAIERKTLIDTEGEELGEVTGVVRHRQTGEFAAVVSTGGWLGGEKVAVPLNQLHLQASNLVLSSALTRKDLVGRAGEYQPDNYIALEGNTPLGELAGVKPSPQPARIASFAELDSDGNGSLTRSESRGESVLLDSWETYDRNNDDRIDRAEFGLFLEQQEREQELTAPEG